jgi:steroid delta-isomerase-like uncharacterized protein
MSNEDVRGIAERFIHAWSTGNSGIIDELASPDLRVMYTHFPQPYEGPAGFKQLLAQTFAAFPDMNITVEEVIPAGNRAVVRWFYNATHQDGEIFGVEASGKEVRVSGITVYEIMNGKVVRENGIVDNLSLAMQLGALPT